MVTDGLLFQSFELRVLFDQLLYLKVRWKAINHLIWVLKPLRRAVALRRYTFEAFRQGAANSRLHVTHELLGCLLLRFFGNFTSKLFDALDLLMDFVGSVLPLVELSLERRTFHQ